jgi:hypothetical protein
MYCFIGGFGVEKPFQRQSFESVAQVLALGGFSMDLLGRTSLSRK